MLRCERCCLENEAGLRSLILHPENAAVVAGKSARFRCASDSSPSLNWILRDGKTSKDTVLVSRCKVNPQYEHIYALENLEHGSCDLVVKNASAVDAGVYSCSESFGWDPESSALLAVLGRSARTIIQTFHP